MINVSSLTLTDTIAPFIYTGTLPIDPPEDVSPVWWQTPITLPEQPIHGRHSERAFKSNSDVPLTVGAIRYLNGLTPRFQGGMGKHREESLDKTVSFQLTWPVEARRPTWRERWARRLHGIAVRLIKDANTGAIRKTRPLPVETDSSRFTLAWAS